MSKKFSLKGKNLTSRKKRADDGSDKSVAAEKFVNSAETETQKDEILFSTNEIMEIPLKLIDANKLNARALYIKDEVKSRAESIANEGQLTPVIVQRIASSDRYELVDGHYRYQAVQLLQRATIRAEVLSERLSGLDLYKASYHANESRKQQSIFDSAVTWKSLLEEEVATRAQLMEMSGKTKGDVSKIVSIAFLPLESIEALLLKETPVGLSEAYAIYQYFKQAERADFDAFAEKLIENNWSRRDIENFIKDSSSQGERKKTKAEPTFSFTDHKGKVAGTINVKGKQVNMKFKASSDEVAQEISEAVAKILEKAND